MTTTACILAITALILTDAQVEKAPIFRRGDDGYRAFRWYCQSATEQPLDKLSSGPEFPA